MSAEKHNDEYISDVRKRINELCEENELQGLLESRHRSRSLTVGQTSGGVVEFGMRNEYSHLYYLVNPVEGVELLGQIASAIGVEIAIRPRDDFASWRSWDAQLPASIHWMGAAPWQLDEDERKKLSEAKSKKISDKLLEESDKTENNTDEGDKL